MDQEEPRDPETRYKGHRISHTQDRGHCTHKGQRTLHIQGAEDTVEITEDLGGGSRKDPFLIKKMFQPASIETQWVKVKLASIFCRRLCELQCGGRGRLKGQASKPGQNTVTSKRQKPPVAIKEISSPYPSNPSPLACPPAPLYLPPETHVETVAPGSTTNSDLGTPESKEAQG